MKGTPLGTSLKARGKALAGATIAAGALTLGATHAEAKELRVTNTRDNGRGSFAAAVEAASREKDLDTIRFQKRLDGRIRVKSMKIPSQVRIIGTGDGRGERGIVVLQGPSLGATMEFTRGKVHKLQDLALERVQVRGNFDESIEGQLKITDTLITGDARDTGVGVSMTNNDRYADGKLTISQSTIEGFRSGVVVDSTDARIGRSTIADNIGGGGVVSAAYSSIEVFNSTISGNQLDATQGYADGGAGARGGYYADVDIYNSTIVGNSVVGEGGYAGAVAYNAEVFESTLTGNSAPAGGAVGAPEEVLGIAGAGEVWLSNSIVAGNTATTPGGGDDCVGGGFITSRGGNVFGAGSPCATKPTDLVGVDPRLGPLRNNGGPTKTMALGEGSPAIGLAVDKFATERDQRGVARGMDPDSGAYEYSKGGR